MKPEKASTAAEARPTPAAIRMRYMRDRRRRGYRCYMVEVGAHDLDGLIERGLLDRLCRKDTVAIERALCALLDQLSRYS